MPEIRGGGRREKHLFPDRKHEYGADQARIAIGS